MKSTPTIIDAHVHLYDTRLWRYPWLDAVPHIKAPFLLQDYAEATSGTTVEQFVFIEVGAHPEDAVSEVRWVADHCAANADDDGFPALGAIVAQARVERGDAVEEELDALLETGKVTGIRRIVAAPFQSDPDVCTSPAFIDGVRRVGRRGLSFDIGAPASYLPKVVTLARACGDAPLVLDHLGMPTGVETPFDDWRRELRALAALPNVFCKISGLLSHAGSDPPAKVLAPYVAEAVEIFGFDRVILGSDYPVHNVAGGVAGWLDTVLTILSGSSEDELRRLCADNAQSVYRVGARRGAA